VPAHRLAGAQQGSKVRRSCGGVRCAMPIAWVFGCSPNTEHPKPNARCRGKALTDTVAPVLGSDEQIFGVNGQILRRDQSD
jgi:hypothetical protein